MLLSSASIPAVVRKYASSISYPVAAIGCRVSSEGMSLDCCEYDLAVFAPENHHYHHHHHHRHYGSNQVLQVAGHTVELIYMAGPIKDHMIDLGGIAVIRDSNRFALSAAANDVSPEKYRRALLAAGRKSLVSSLFCQRKTAAAAAGAKQPPTVAAMWLKIAAYEFIRGALALSGSRSMPLHELEQVRRVDASALADGIQAALECIGVERATRPAISRSIGAIRELKSKEYDAELVMSKIRHLMDRQMLADCYYYAGRVAAKNLAARSSAFHNRYAKLVQLSMDLTSDLQHLQKLQRQLFRAANVGLGR
jgi:hypothetical protein